MVATFIRPDADISDGGWTDEGGATTLFDAVDESSFSDSDYIKSSASVGDKVRLRLSDPATTFAEPMIVRFRCKREGLDPVDLTGRLYEATSPETIIAEFVQTITSSFATYTYELTAGEFASIGDFNNLFVQFEPTNVATLLDMVSASAHIAYSTRKLRTAYVGSALRVRRSSDNSESDIGFDGSGNLDTADLATFVGANDGFIVTLYDQSGNAINAAQATAGMQPKIVNGGSLLTFSSKASIRYANASGTRLEFSTTLSQPDSIAFVMVQTSAVTNAHFTDGTSLRQLVTADTTQYRMYAGSSVLAGGTVDTNAHGIVCVFDGASSALYVDNTSTISGNPGTGGIDSEYIGAGTGGDSFNGDIPEYIIFTSSVGSTDRSTIRTSWTNYWGTP